MSDSDRVQRWRSRMREEGKKPLTLWLDTADTHVLETMAARQHCSPADVVHQLLAASPVTVTVTDTEHVSATVTDTGHVADTVTATVVTDTVTATLRQMLPIMVREVIQELCTTNTPPVSATVTDTVTATAPVTDTVTATRSSVADTVTDAPVIQGQTNGIPQEPKRRGRKPVLREPILAVLREHADGLTAMELKVYLKTEKPIGDTLAGMVKAHLLVKQGSRPGVRYVLATPDCAIAAKKAASQAKPKGKRKRQAQRQEVSA